MGSDAPLQFPRLATSRHIVVPMPEVLQFDLDNRFDIAAPGINEHGPYLKMAGVDDFQYSVTRGADATAFLVATLDIHGVRIMRDYFAQVVHWMEAEQRKSEEAKNAS